SAPRTIVQSFVTFFGNVPGVVGIAYDATSFAPACVVWSYQFGQPAPGQRLIAWEIPCPLSALSAGLGGAPANGPSQAPAVSADGRVVAFDSVATNLVPSGCTTGVRQVFVVAGSVSCVSTGAGAAPGNGASSDPAVSADGRFIAFVSAATNLTSPC